MNQMNQTCVPLKTQEKSPGCAHVCHKAVCEGLPGAPAPEPTLPCPGCPQGQQQPGLGWAGTPRGAQPRLAPNVGWVGSAIRGMSQQLRLGSKQAAERELTFKKP